MKYSDWPDGSYPVYIQPTIKEIFELAESKWDTVRICIDEDRNILALASGYGNTHDSVIQMVRRKRDRRFFPTTYILYKEHGQFYFNMEDVSGSNKEPARKAIKENFTKEVEELLLDLLTNS